MRALLRSGVGGSLALWVLMCAMDPGLLAVVGPFDVMSPLTGEVIYGERVLWVAGQAPVLIMLIWMMDDDTLSQAAVPISLAFGTLLILGLIITADGVVFRRVVLAEQVWFQVALLPWLLRPQHPKDRLAAGALFMASLLGLAMMADAQLKLSAMPSLPDGMALAFSMAWGAWSLVIVPAVGIVLLAVTAAAARRDPTWTAPTPTA